MMSDEETWILHARQGDQRAFKKLYDANVDSLFRFLKQYSHDVSQVEDWVQRAFVKSYKHLGSFRGASRFSTWLFTIAMNEMRTDLRKPALLVLQADDLEKMEAYESGEELFIWNDMMKTLLHRLDDLKRSVFILYEVEGYSHAEIASILNIGENASRSILCRTKQWLRTEWNLMEKSA